MLKFLIKVTFSPIAEVAKGANTLATEQKMLCSQKIHKEAAGLKVCKKDARTRNKRETISIRGSIRPNSSESIGSGLNQNTVTKSTGTRKQTRAIGLKTR